MAKKLKSMFKHFKHRFLENNNILSKKYAKQFFYSKISITFAPDYNPKNKFLNFQPKPIQ